ncbi:MAG: Gldg family protein, partial [Clostridia bacterium]|nr:Gldg family protein [Clostridia bacterium]
MAKEKHRTGKLKYGSVSALMLAMVLIALIALNAGVYALEKNKGWRVDLSFNGILSQSADTKAVLESLDKPVEIYALFRKANEREWPELQELLDKYAAASDRITWKQVDPMVDQLLVNRFSTDNAVPGEGNLIVWCEQTNQFRIVGGEDFIGQGFDIETGEMVYENLTFESSITGAIAYVVKDEVPKAVILQGHDEYGPELLTDFQNLLEANQFDVVYQDLKEEDYTPNPEDLLIFFDPMKDLTEPELKKLTEFAGKGGSFLFASDYTTSMDGMPRYATLLRSYGFEPLEGFVEASQVDQSSYYESQTYLLPEMCSTDITMDLVGTDRDFLILPGTRAFAEPEEGDRNLLISVVLRAAETAVIRTETAVTEPDGTEGFPLALQARRVTNEGYVSRAFIIGCGQTLIDKSLYSITRSQELTVNVMEFLLQKGKTGLNIAPKDAARPGLKTESLSLGSILLIALPLSVLFAALLILGPR